MYCRARLCCLVQGPLREPAVAQPVVATDRSALDMHMVAAAETQMVLVEHLEQALTEPV
jgi:hypothetical protein